LPFIQLLMYYNKWLNILKYIKKNKDGNINITQTQSCGYFFNITLFYINLNENGLNLI